MVKLARKSHYLAEDTKAKIGIQVKLFSAPVIQDFGCKMYRLN